MIRWLRTRLQQQLPGDETWRRDTTRLLRISLLANLVVSGTAVVSAFVFRMGDWQYLVLNSSIGVVVAGALWLLLQRGFPRLAAAGTVSAYMLIMLFAAYQGAGVFSLSYGLYVLVVIASAMLLPRQAAFWVAGVGSLAGLVIMVAHRLDSIANLDILPPEAAVWVTMSAYFFVVAAMLNMTLRQAERSLQQAQHNLAERQRAEDEVRLLNAQLESRVAERTAELAASQQRYQNFIELSAEGIWLLSFDQPIALDLPFEEQARLVLQHGYVAECNYVMAQKYGYVTPEDMIGKHLLDLSGGQPGEASFRSMLQLAQMGYRSTNRLIEDITEQGEHLYFLDNSVGMIEEGRLVGLWGTQRDITELKRAEQALRLNELRYRALFERTNDAVFIISLDNKHITANRRAVTLLGYTVDELVELKHTRDIIIPSEYEESREKFTALLAGEAVPVYERHFIRKDGTILAVEIDAALVRDEEGRPLHIQSIARDITERKKTEEEFHRLNQTLEQRVARRTAELEAAVKEMESLSYHISHSLRSPLRAINGFATILQQEYQSRLDASGLGHLLKIESNTRLMGQMIDELLLFLRLGRMTIVKHQVDTAAVVQQVLDRLAPAGGGQRAQFIVGELPACRADEALLVEVFNQLISNAIKFSANKNQPQVEIGYSRVEGGAYFVRDNGVGFDMRFAGKIFGVFQRLVLPEEFEGTGIGLAIAQRIVTRHGGHIWAEAEVGKGATFYFTLG